MKKIDVLDKGYVRLVDVLGSDLTPVNAARVSYDKASEVLSERDKRLINFLIREKHTSPFRHAVLQFEVYAPLMIARQWWKHIIGSSHQEGAQDPMTAWNESSRRYVSEAVKFYIPAADQWRSSPEDTKQGSGAMVPLELGEEATKKLLEQIEEGMKNYEWASENGIATEMARLFLPSAYGLYVRWYWTVSLQGLIHFLDLRSGEGAQSEIRDYAAALETLAREAFPVSVAAFEETKK
ncbi:MAG: FAD-dependent thymidylate synthase [Tissierellia bacterium]|nr:FAD-dependent thymidylate synthase [Bacillota bacterium]NLL23717.1 FAD-dependent thymidylate synthase [Tissierellia bacterium]